jgi:hypothetical protein
MTQRRSRSKGRKREMVATRSKMGRWNSWRRRKRSVRKKGKEELLPAGIKVEARGNR